MPKKSKKAKGLSEKVRKFLTFFNPGAVLIERKVTPEIKKATKKVRGK
jgi:hypothetical protein